MTTDNNETPNTTEGNNNTKKAKPRSLADLYDMDSYSDMTDEEIELVTEFKYKLKTQNEENESLYKQLKAAINNNIAASAIEVENSRAAFEKIMSMFPACESAAAETVEFKTFKPTTIEFDSVDNTNNDSEVSN
jgi:hypothetical protein